jgi:xylan 1,4-beta-xylosidase
LLQRCAESLRRRDNPDAKLRNGIPKHDSLRCGAGSEITTYDSLDTSLGQARNNLYLSVKALGAWLTLQGAFHFLSLTAQAKAAEQEAARLSQTLATQFDREAQMFPAVFENGNASRIIPAVEGLVYPLFLKQTQALSKDGPLKNLLPLLEKHLCAILHPGICLDARSGAWKMSSTSTNTWLSKIALSQHVVRQLFPKALNDLARAADAVHASWQRGPSAGAHAFCDQIQSDTGVTCGSRYYPRGVTAVLWLDE